MRTLETANKVHCRVSAKIEAHTFRVSSLQAAECDTDLQVMKSWRIR